MAEAPDSLYVWMERNANGQWGTIAAYVPVLCAMITLAAISRDLADGPFRELAKSHARKSGHRVALRRYGMIETIEMWRNVTEIPEE